MLRTEFVLPVGRIPASAVVHVVGLGQFQLRINGADVGGDANVPVVISADKSVRYESVVRVMDTLQRAGVKRVAPGLLPHLRWQPPSMASLTGAQPEARAAPGGRGDLRRSS
jgi:hypothetical protein